MSESMQRAGLVCFDMDGTLIHGTTADLHFAKLLAVSEPVEEMERAFRTGLMSSREFMVEIAARMPDLTTDYVEKYFVTLPLMEGIGEVTAALRTLSIISMIATSSAVDYANCFKREFGFDYVFGARHEIGADRRIGPGVEECSAEDKARHLATVCGYHGLPLARTVAVGDSLNDRCVFAAAGLSIALNADPAVEALANVSIRGRDLRAVLNHVAAHLSGCPAQLQ